MRALWIAERFPPQRGGVATAAGRLVSGLAPALDRLDVLCLDRELAPGSASAAAHGRATVHRLGRPSSGEDAAQLLFRAAVALGHAGAHDLVHGFYAVPAGHVALLAARALARPSLVSLRGNDVHRSLFHGPHAALLDRVLAGADALAAVSRELLELVGRVSGRRHGVHLVPNGVDAAVFAPGDPDRSHLRALDGRPRPWIGFFGELRLKKGLPVLVELARMLETEGAGTLVLVGGVRADARDEASALLCHTSAVAEVPYVKDPAALVSLYRAMDLVVLPSLWDGLPNALLEAMACGCPVLASDAGGIPDAVEDGVSGLLCPLAELDRFPGRVREALALGTGRLRDLGLAARDRVLRDFTPERETEGTLALYRAVVKAGAGGAG